MPYDTAHIRNAFSASYRKGGIGNNERLLHNLSGFALGSSDNELNQLTLPHHLCLAIDSDFWSYISAFL
jgi:hypothetical protein